MKILVLILTSAILTFSQQLQVKSVKTSVLGSPKAPPIVEKGNKLKIEFDVKSTNIPDLAIVFRFCDQNWKIYDNIFLKNNNRDMERNLWFEKLPVTAIGADYHYEGVFPGNNVSFPFSGKWRYFVTDYSDTSIIYASGKFIMLNEGLPLSLEISRQRLEGRTVEPSTFGQVFNITTKIQLPDSMEDFRLKNVEIIENQKFDYPFVITKEYTGSDKYYEWSGGNRYQFTIQNIEPGNEYRQADIRDKNKYSAPYTNAHFDGVDVSRLFDTNRPYKDFNGSFLLNDYRNEYSNYMNVTFELRAPEKYDNDVFLVGSFTDWKVLPEFKMFLDDDNLYYLTVELKRGIYDYQYVTANDDDGKINDINWLIIEGNSWNTNNDYYVFVYYDTEKKGGFDEIIGYKKISSTGK